MCLGMPGQIVDMSRAAEHLATAVVGGIDRDVNVGLLLGEEGGLKVGDWIIIHMGFAMERIDEAEANRITGFMINLNDIWEEYEPSAQAVDGGA